MILVAMPTILTAMLIAAFLGVTLYVLAGREVAIDLVRCVGSALVRRLRAIRRRMPFSAATAALQAPPAAVPTPAPDSSAPS